MDFRVLLRKSCIYFLPTYSSYLLSRPRSQSITKRNVESACVRMPYVRRGAIRYYVTHVEAWLGGEEEEEDMNERNGALLVGSVVVIEM